MAASLPATEAQRAQRRLVLTPHPLQRVGAFALAELAGVGDPGLLLPEDFQRAVDAMAEHAVQAAHVPEADGEGGFWLKASGSFFPNSKMNHNSRLKKDPAGLAQRVRDWRRMPSVERWPEVACALCGRPACGYYGKMDVVLAESDAYRNTTPRGHAGLALCWPCLCSFHALPYGCRLTGGPSTALHSWDDNFQRRVVARQVARNHRHIALGQHVSKDPVTAEVAALHHLRNYDDPLTAGVDLIVFSNNNRNQMLEIYSLEQPLAEWLRSTVKRVTRRDGFRALLRAHRGPRRSGLAALASNAFRRPSHILNTAARYLVRRLDQHGGVPEDAADLAALCFSFSIEVMQLNDRDVQLVQALARNVALMLAENDTAGPLKGFRRDSDNPRLLRRLLEKWALSWLLRPPDGASSGR